jgi:uncharacterized membrane protein
MNDISHNLPSQTRVTHIIYALSVLGFVTGGLTSLVAIIMLMVKRDDVRDTFLASHFKQLISVYVWGALWSVVAIVLWLVSFAFILTLFGINFFPPMVSKEIAIPCFVIGLLILLGNTIWSFYRMLKGWLKLNNEKPFE